MTDWDTIEADIESPAATPRSLLAAGERCLENWVEARGEEPTRETREGFRLLALHRQGTGDEPSFNACRETAREIAYHYNLLKEGGPEQGSAPTLASMVMVTRHLMLFVRGKMEVAGLGEFCCAAKPIRANDAQVMTETRG
jgi:hypothetical protein